MDKHEVNIQVSSVKNDYYVDKEYDINRIVDNLPCLTVFINEGYPKWTHKTRKQKEQGSEHIPVNFYRVVRIDEVLLLWIVETHAFVTTIFLHIDFSFFLLLIRVQLILSDFVIAHINFFL
jgi:hypothetical protein